MLPLYIKLFNVILNTGVVPESLLIGQIIPILKNKGRRDDPTNYLTRVSCLEILFTSIINTRLQNFSDEINLLNENQVGFCRGCSTLNHTYVLRFICDIFLSNWKLYCCFIDYA